ncbi:SX2_G0036690.mRNA.1.CDS.1 [Saccharomyces cerevisiae]|nr:SX2_G0036690.mRNA.1.CDS.1 [Saccharomyces cerevisiae]
MESIFLHINITIISPPLYVPLPYYIINPCISASSNFDESFSYHYHLLTSIYVTSILSYTVLEDDANDEK